MLRNVNVVAKMDDFLSDPWIMFGEYIHKDGSNGRYYDKNDIICHHENMEYLEEYEDSPYFIKHCPNCGFFMTKRFEETKDND